MKRSLTMLMLCLGLSNLALAEETAAEKSAAGVSDWQLGFGLGVEQYRDPYIDSASLQGEDKIVTTEQSYKTRPSAWLTLNWNIWGLGSSRKSSEGNDVYNTKWGFFAGVKLIDANSEAFSAFALGPQVTFQTKSQAISVGLGWVTHGTKTFANGIEEGKALPAQYDEVVYRKGTENSYMLMMSIGI